MITADSRHIRVDNEATPGFNVFFLCRLVVADRVMYVWQGLKFIDFFWWGGRGNKACLLKGVCRKSNFKAFYLVLDFFPLVRILCQKSVAGIRKCLIEFILFLAFFFRYAQSLRVPFLLVIALCHINELKILKWHIFQIHTCYHPVLWMTEKEKGVKSIPQPYYAVKTLMIFLATIKR